MTRHYQQLLASFKTCDGRGAANIAVDLQVALTIVSAAALLVACVADVGKSDVLYVFANNFSGTQVHTGRFRYSTMRMTQRLPLPHAPRSVDVILSVPISFIWSFVFI